VSGPVTSMVDLASVEAAAARLNGRIRRTPTVRADMARQPLGVDDLWLKLECLQVTGSFKARGATNKLLTSDPARLRNGIVAASGGNHGLAVARAGQVAGVPTTIFLPSTASPAKIEKLRGWGARVEVVGSVWDEAHAAALATAEAAGAFYIHPFADPEVVAGQGTVALEILEEIGSADVFVIAIGGGGLIAGMATVLQALRPDARIIGVEPEGSPTLKNSLDAGEVVRLAQVTTKVATMACGRTDPAIFDIVRRSVQEVVLVSDQDLEQASRWLWFEMGIAADLSGAASVAALMTGAVRVEPGQRVCGLVCGAGPEGVLLA
jgi:threonine dehydratase